MADTPWVIVSTSLHHYVKTASGREIAAVIRPIHDLAKTPAELEQTQSFQDALRIVNAVNAAGQPAPAVPPNIRALVDDFGLSVATWRNSKKGPSREQAHRESIAAKRALLNAYGVTVVDPVQVERERCARIADDEARIREEAGRTHPEDSEARGRCFAAARAAANVANGIRSGEVVSGAPVVRQADSWRPINSAPKDGREVILREGNRVGAACWVKWPDTYDSDGAPAREGGEGWTVGYDGNEWRAPTHWQPLPTANGVLAVDGSGPTDSDLRDVWLSITESMPAETDDERRIAFARAVLSMRCASL